MRTFAIYKITNLWNGKMYVGKTTNFSERINRHFELAKHPKTKLHSALKKYGRKNFRFNIICYCKNADELNKRERHYIKIYDSRSRGYNLTEGAEGGDTFSRKTLAEKKKILAKRSRSMRGKNVGKKCSVEQREKISASLLGFKQTEETREKHRARWRNETFKSEMQSKISAVMRDRFARIPKKAQPVKQLSLNGRIVGTWRCAEEAAKILNVSKGNLSSVLLGRRHTAGGFRWTYVAAS